MPWLSVNHTRLCRFRAVPKPVFALEVQRGGIPGQPGAMRSALLKVTSSKVAEANGTDKQRANFTRRRGSGGHGFEPCRYSAQSQRLQPLRPRRLKAYS